MVQADAVDLARDAVQQEPAIGRQQDSRRPRVVERRRVPGPLARVDPERVERIASRIAGSLLLLLAAYLVVDAGRRLIGFGREASERATYALVLHEAVAEAKGRLILDAVPDLGRRLPRLKLFSVLRMPEIRRVCSMMSSML